MAKIFDFDLNIRISMSYNQLIFLILVYPTALY